MITNWHRRWFILKGKFLYYYFSREDEIPIGVISLENTQVKIPENAERKFSFSLVTPRREYVFTAENSSDLFTWMTAIREGIDCLSENDDTPVSKNRFSVNLTKRHSFALNHKHIKQCGYLYKKGNNKIRKDWKSRYCILYKNCLYYYESQNEKLPLGIVDLEMTNISKGKESHRKYRFQVQTPGRTYYFYAETSQDREKWLKALTQPLQPLHE